MAPVVLLAVAQNQQAACPLSVAIVSTPHLPQSHLCLLCTVGPPHGPHGPTHYTGQPGTATHQGWTLIIKKIRVSLCEQTPLRGNTTTGNILTLCCTVGGSTGLGVPASSQTRP